MTKWQEVKLGDVCDVKGGKRLPKGVNLVTIKNTHPYIRVRDLGQGKRLQLNQNYEYVDDETQKIISNYIVSEGDVLISIVGTIGLIGIVGNSLNNANLTENCVKLINLRGIDKDFLYYFLISNSGQDAIKQGTVGAVQAKLPIKNIQTIQILLPPLDVQKKIARVLGALDDKIELNNRINNNLEQQAQALFKSWFVDFEPFGGTMPDDWKIGKLEDVADVIMGQSPSGNSYNEKGRGCIFFQGRAEFGFRFPTIKLFTTEPRRMARQNDILMSVRAPVGDVNVAHEDCCIGRGLCAIRSKDNFQSFILYTLWSVQNKLNIFNGEGTVFGSINKDSLNNLEIIVPNSNTIQKFENLCSPMDNLIRKNYEENTRLSALRDTLLPKLMSGEIDVSKVNILADKLSFTEE